MTKPTATYKPKTGEGKARSRKQAKDMVWNTDDATQALTDGKARKSSPEIDDAFLPTPPHHPEGKRMAPRPPGTQITTPPSGDLWDAATKLAEDRKKELEEEEIVTPVEAKELGNVTAPIAPTAGDVVEAAMVQAEKRVWDKIGLDPIAGSRLAQYLECRERATLELQDGTFSMPVIDVIKSKFSVTLIIPLDKNATSFVPKPGTALSLRWGDTSESVYFPGSYVEVVPLMVAAMTFIRAEDE